jgi:hypothetical protein
MGLDMYLSKKFYIWKEKREKLKISGVKEIEGQEVKELVMDAGYWRKANAIHNWFVEKLADDEDYSGHDLLVSKEDMQELLDAVNKVLKASVLVKGKIQNGSRSYKNEKTGEYVSNEPIMEDGEYIKDPTVAKELLPTTEGFFFGSQAYDQYYYNDLVDTKKILEKALAEADKGFEFYYSASW